MQLGYQEASSIEFSVDAPYLSKIDINWCARVEVFKAYLKFTLLSAELSLRRPVLNLNLTEIQNLIDVMIELINANYFYQ